MSVKTAYNKAFDKVGSVWDRTEIVGPSPRGSKTPLRFSGADDLARAPNETRKAQSLRQLGLARDHAWQALTPDKTAFISLVPVLGDKEPTFFPAAVPAALLGAAMDAVEAVPSALLALMYLGASAVNALKKD